MKTSKKPHFNIKIKKAAIYSLLVLAATFAILATVPEKGTSVTLKNKFVKTMYDKFTAFNHMVPEDRVYVQLDKPFYKPGETIWFSAHVRDGKTMHASKQSDIVHAELINPKGAVMKKLQLIAKKGLANGDFDLGAEIPGGLYKIKAYTQWQKNEGETHLFEKEIQVQKVVLPNLKMKLDFKRKAYGPGDEVTAKLDLHTNSNKALANHNINFVASLKGVAFTNQKATTDENGKHTIAFTLPSDLTTSDGLLNVMIQFEGRNESISRSIPISLNNISMSFFPEGGDLVEDLKSKVAFKALNEFGKPADIEGEVRNSKGEKVAWFKSFHNGMGAFDFEPENGETYTAHITKPVGVDQEYVMPEPLPKGFILNTEQTKAEELEITIRSTQAEEVSLIGQLRGEIYYTNAIQLDKGTNRIKVPTTEFPTGVAQFTLFDAKEIERAERLVFVNKHRELNIAVTTDKEKYQPREKVQMTVKVTDERGVPMPANLSMSVVNDQLLSFADDKSGNILSSMLLSYDITEKIEEPAFYFDKKEPKSDKAMDFLMMTAGWRRYTWDMVRNNEVPVQKFAAQRIDVGGKVLDAYTHKPIEGAYVQVPQNKNMRAEVDQNGVFNFRSLELTSRTNLSSIAPGYYTQNKAIYTYGSNYIFYLYPKQNNNNTNLTTSTGVRSNFSVPTNSSNSVIVNANGSALRNVEIQMVPAAQNLSAIEVVSHKEPLIRAPFSRKKSAKMALKAKAAKPIIMEDNEEVELVEQMMKAPEEAPQQVKNELIREDAKIDQLIAVNSHDNKEAEMKVEEEEMRMEFDNVEDADEELLVQGGIFADIAIAGDFKQNFDKDLEVNGRIHNNKQSVSLTHYYRARQFPAAPAKTKSGGKAQRTDFRSTIYWNGNVVVGRTGKTTMEFFTSDEITSFQTTVEGISSDGMIGRAEKKFYSQLPFMMAAKTPVSVATKDKITIPITLKNNTGKTLSGILKVIAPFAFKQVSKFTKEQILQPGETRVVYVKYNVMNIVGAGTFEASFVAAGMSDAFSQNIETVATGFPTTYSFSGDETKNEYQINLHDVVEGSISAQLVAFPSVVSDLITGVEGILREPGGCFEQTSMSSYPNIMVVDYMQTMGQKNEKVMASAEGMIDRGYKRLTTFETKTKGYEWFGQSPAHEGLTAYGLMQFSDMKKVYGNVDEKMIDRTARWILSKRDGTGKFHRKTNRQLHNFGRISEDVMNAYITAALIDAGYKGLDKELEYSYKKALENKDPYLMALMATAAYQYGDAKRGDAMLSKLLAVQKADGSIAGTTHSITYSTGNSLIIETTSLAILAMLEAPNPNRLAMGKAVQYLVKSRSGYGSFGNTQGTVLALKALTAFAKASKVPKENGTIQFFVDGKKVAEQNYTAGGQEAIKLDSLGKFLSSGKHVLKVKFVGVKEALPHSLAVSYSTSLPKSNAKCKVLLKNSISSTNVKVGETVRLKTKIKNMTNEGIPSTIAIIGIPAGLSAQPWQLKELQEKKVFAYYEVRGNNIVAYYRGLAPNEVKEINLDLKAEVPGEFDAPASSAYLYYTNEFKSWNAIDRITVRK